jgi:DNA repair exonuclease SbcCD ATPase subunit
METRGLDLEQEAREVSRLSGRVSNLKAFIARDEAELEKAKDTHKHAQAAQQVLQALAQAIQQKAHSRIAEVVSSCLSSVFGDEAYEFVIEFEQKRGKTEAVLKFRRNGQDVFPLEGSGGGVVDVAAFALRVACLMLHRPRLSKLLVLDEPFRFVSEQYRPAVREMIEKLASDMGLQIILVTHQEEFVTGKVIRL